MTTTTLRPNATLTTGFSVVGAATAHAALSDNSDASYTIVKLPNSMTEVDLGTVTLSAGAVTKSIRVRFRVSQNVAGVPATVYGSVRDGFTLAQLAGAGVAAFDAGGGIVPFTWSAAYQPVTLTQDQVNVLRVRLQLASVSSSDEARFYETYVDLIWVPAPVANVAAVSPDPVTATNIVPLSWTNTLNSDGGAQTRYQIRVFTAAQVAAGGFDPATSTAYWESGEVISASTSAVTGVLDTGITYTAYVRVAQTVNGASHWSAYDSDTFAIDVNTADVDTVTAVAVDTHARIDVAVDRDALGEAWEYIEVERSVDSGSTWVPVRGATYVVPSDANEFTISDYETGNGQAALYRARASRIVSGVSITGAWVQSAAAVAWESTSVWLKSPTDASKNLTVDVHRPFQTRTYGTRVGVFSVIGSPMPVAISDVISNPSQTLTIDTITEADSDALLALLRELILLYCPTDCEGTESVSYLAVTGASMTPTPERGIVRRRWTVSVVEVAAPGDPLASAP